MSNTYFQFKQFKIQQDQCAMKVGTDGVLLGAWTPIIHNQRVLDIGAGTGLVSLMLAQRGAGEVVGVELDLFASEQACINVANSPFAQKVKIVNEDILCYHASSPFDLIVSNPPYFNNALPCDNAKRNLARHADSGLTLNRLIEKASQLIIPNGSFVVILPSDLEKMFIDTCAVFHFTLAKKLTIFTRAGKRPKRCIFLMKYTTDAITPEYENLILTNDTDNVRSDAYKQLTTDFYIDIS